MCMWQAARDHNVNYDIHSSRTRAHSFVCMYICACLQTYANIRVTYRNHSTYACMACTRQTGTHAHLAAISSTSDSARSSCTQLIASHTQKILQRDIPIKLAHHTNTADTQRPNVFQYEKHRNHRTCCLLRTRIGRKTTHKQHPPSDIKNLLTTILYSFWCWRAKQLTTHNSITTLITASLNVVSCGHHRLRANPCCNQRCDNLRIFCGEPQKNYMMKNYNVNGRRTWECCRMLLHTARVSMFECWCRPSCRHLIALYDSAAVVSFRSVVRWNKRHRCLSSIWVVITSRNQKRQRKTHFPPHLRSHKRPGARNV